LACRSVLFWLVLVVHSVKAIVIEVGLAADQTLLSYGQSIEGLRLLTVDVLEWVGVSAALPIVDASLCPSNLSFVKIEMSLRATLVYELILAASEVHSFVISLFIVVHHSPSVGLLKILVVH
jgi:hypothetical protein